MICEIKVPIQSLDLQKQVCTYVTYDQIFLISDWCTKIYEHIDFKGWEKVVGETSQLDLTGNEEDELTSVRVGPGCTVNLFENHNNDGLLGSLTSDVSYYDNNDQVSSLSCICQVIRKRNYTKSKQTKYLGFITKPNQT